MDIREHILAGHYPLDDKGRALVPMDNGRTATICAVDMPDDTDAIIGWLPRLSGRGVIINRWPASGNDPGYKLLPPPPRKVKVTAWMLIYPDGSRWFSETRYPDPLPSWKEVELTGEYEESWQDEQRSTVVGA